MTVRGSARCSIRSRARSLRFLLVMGRTTGTMSTTQLPNVIRRPVIVPPRATAVPSNTVHTAPTQRDRHLRQIAERGRMGWQKSGYNQRALVEAAIGRYKRVIGDSLRSRTHRRQATEAAIVVDALNRMLELGRPKSVRIA